MRKIKTRYPSFPEVDPNKLLKAAQGVVWQVVCGDRGHWRAGMYSPKEKSSDEIKELELHNCPELFLLIKGKLNLLICDNGKIVDLPLKPLEPVLVSAPHSGYCPRGPHEGIAFVVERDSFDTIYRKK